MQTLLKKTKALFCNLSVSNKIIAVTAFSSLITLCILCTILFYREKSAFAERKVTELETLARILSSNTVASLRFDDPFTATEYVESLQHDPAIESVSIYNKHGELFSHYSRDLKESSYPAPTFQGERWHGDSLFYARTVALNGIEIGAILLESNTASLKLATRESLLISIGLILGGLLVTVLLVKRMQGTITNPIKELAALTESISQGKDGKQRLEKQGNDEIGTLIDGFNHMLDTVQKQDQSLRKINLSLGRIVEERTQNLRAKNNELREAIQKAQAASNAKSEFLATVSHELRTPMTAIIGLASILDETNLDEHNRYSVKTIIDSSDILLQLINDLLDFSKIEAGKLELEHIPFELLPALEETLQIKIDHSKKTKITCVLNCSNSLPKTILGDPSRFKQIIINLLNNALKFTEAGHVILSADVSGNKLRISVEDTGIGIPQNKLNTLFQEFNQVDSSTTRKYGGTGLGLAISKRLVVAMKGTINVSSEENKGSLFSIEIPFEQPTKNQSEKALGALKNPKNDHIDRVMLFNLEEPLSSSLQQLLSTWNCSICKTDFNLLILSAIAEDATTASQLAAKGKDAAGANNYVVIALEEHFTKLREDGHKHLVPAPLMISHLRRTLNRIANTPSNLALNRHASPHPIKILLVEDHKINQNVFIRLMQKEGHDIDIANNGVEGLAAFEEKHHDLIFMDMHMPVMDGLECTKQIREKQPKSKQPWIIAYTANVQKSAAAELRQAGVDEIIYKPIKRLALKNILQTHYEQFGSKKSTDPAN